MTTKGPSRKQVIIPMSGENINIFMCLTSTGFYTTPNRKF